MAYIQNFIAMFIWGSVGIFVKQIDMPTTLIVLARTFFGSIFLFAIYLFQSKSKDLSKFKKYFWQLACAGVALALNWIMLFEAYKYAGVGMGTVLNYIAPALIILASPFVLKEKLTKYKLIGVSFAMLGMLLLNISAMGGGFSFKGILLGVGSGCCYAANVLISKFIKGFSGIEISLAELTCAVCVFLPYALLTCKGQWVIPAGNGIFYLAIVCIVHTGIAYGLYYTSIQKIPAQSAAMYSYIDPLFAIFLSIVLLKETLAPVQIAGAALIIGGALIGELCKEKPKQSLK